MRDPAEQVDDIEHVGQQHRRRPGEPAGHRADDNRPVIVIEPGRFEEMVGTALDGLPADLGEMMRNVAVTAPYFHDGRTSSLAEAVATMARSQLGRDLPKRDRDLIVEFLGTLTGKYRGRSLPGAADRKTP